MKEGLSTREVAEIVGVPESRIRYWAQIGLVGPTYRDVEHGREAPRPSYAFADLVAAKAAAALTARGIQARRVREAILALRAQLPSLDRPILHLRVLSDGERLVVAGDQPYEPLTGQRIMDFTLDDLSREVARRGGSVPRPIAPDLTQKEAGTREGSGPVLPQTALEWFEAGLKYAMTDAEAAMQAYARALERDPQLGPAHANLGALLAAAGRLDEAERHLETALSIDPGSPSARANRASLHELRDEHEQALSLWAGLLPDAPARPPVRAGVVRSAGAVRRRQAL